MNGGAAVPVREMVRVLGSLSDPWPEGYQMPTMVISCVPATSVDGNPPADFVMPLEWLRSPTGGVVVEVSPLFSSLRSSFSVPYLALFVPPLSISITRYPSSSTDADIVTCQLAYEPLVTPLVAQMRAIRDNINPSWVVVDGLEVVAEMAIEAFELMTGRMAPKRLMKEVCRKTWEGQQQRRAA